MWLIKQSLTLSLVLAVAGVAGDTTTKKRPVVASEDAESTRSAVLWVDPVDLESRNLLYGSGGQDRAPKGTTFTFEKENMNGTNPKIDVHASDGVKWKVKLGPEARPETAATRLVWAVGYFTTDSYLVPEFHVEGLPKHLHRGQDLVGPGGSMSNGRFKRNPTGYENAGIWKWKHDPFTDTRVYNGLRVMMALLNNWDLKDENNEVLERKKSKDSNKPSRLYIVSDLGDSFGPSGLGLQHNERKGNLESYRQSEFITKANGEYVDFSIPSRPALPLIFNPKEYHSRVELEWIGHHVPRADVKWMGELLARLSGAQIRDAFRAGGFSPEEVEGFATIVEARISALKNL